MKIRTIVVAAQPELRDCYQQQVAAPDVLCDSVASLEELFETLKETPYNGLLIDLATLVKANKAEKTLCHEILRLYPTLRLKWDESSEQLRCLLYGNITNTRMSLETFIDEHCRPFEARRIRSDKRVKLHYNALISKDDKFQRLDVERSTTLDISIGGCSLLTNQQWELSETVWLRFVEFEDQTPVQAKICRWTCWGTPMKIPSIGVCFESLTESQTEQINHPGKLIYDRNKKPD